ncbi:MAG: hypothetical protein ACC655_10320, partial [Rhodothermia bacterium]
MHFLKSTLVAIALIGFATTARGQNSDYEDLVSLFQDWRAFQKPQLLDGIPDYSSGAMARQHGELARYRDRLVGIDTTGWSISNRVDYHLVWAEMNGLDFDHRLMRPWARDPAFYVMLFWNRSDVPEREAPQVEGTIELWSYEFPLSEKSVEEVRAGLKRIPPLYQSARSNLVGNARDLWVAGTGSIDAQVGALDRLAEAVTGSHDDLLPDIDAARTATGELRDWLTVQGESKDGASGIGVENYEWYLQNVHLVPYTWDEQMTLIRRELDRAHAALRLEEQRNRDLPPLEPVGSSDEYEAAFEDAVTRFMEFLREKDVLTLKDYMEGALRAQRGTYVPVDQERGFFTIVNYHDPIVMRTHQYHWIELARMANEPNSSPIRSTPLLYNIFDGRAEGLATWMEEAMMHAGLLDDSPRSRDPIWILLAQRGARALAAMYMHSNQMSMQEAAAFASKRVPRGWLPANGSTIQDELHFYLRQPVYGTSYVLGKTQLDGVLAERSLQE